VLVVSGLLGGVQSDLEGLNRSLVGLLHTLLRAFECVRDARGAGVCKWS
jgi:hypothetical protein